MDHQGILVVVSGFSGAGKGTLMKELLKQYDNYALSVSATTRQPREGEKDGEDYFFVTKELFRHFLLNILPWGSVIMIDVLGIFHQLVLLNHLLEELLRDKEIVLPILLAFQQMIEEIGRAHV